MTQYQETIKIKGKKYIIQWIDVDFNTFEHVDGFENCSSIEEFSNLILSHFPNCNLTYK